MRAGESESSFSDVGIKLNFGYNDEGGGGRGFVGKVAPTSRTQSQDGEGYDVQVQGDCFTSLTLPDSDSGFCCHQ